MAEELPVAANRLMGYCRSVALMSKEEFSLHYGAFSMAEKRTLNTIPAVHSKPPHIEFPWHPTGHTANTQTQERSPPLAHAVPDILPAPDVPAEDQDEAAAPNTNGNRRRRRATEADSGSDDSYEAPVNPPRRQRVLGRATAQATTEAAPVDEIEKVQNLLRSYGSKLKYQRFEDDRPVTQPSFETQRYRTLVAVQETEEQELVAKLVLSVKENLALAFESSVRAVHHHYVAAEKLVMLQERLDKPEFLRILEELSMSKR